MNIVSLFSGCGGLDLGFENAGFKIIWANEYDKDIWATYELNHSDTVLDRRSIIDVPAEDIPDCDGIIGGPPCQSWSAGGAKRGIEDSRGQLFWDYIRILNAKNPKFFVAENVKGMLSPRHKNALDSFKSAFQNAGKYGYDLFFQCVNAADYGVPEDRYRVLFIGFRKDLGVNYKFPQPQTPEGARITLRSAIFDLASTSPIPLKNEIVEANTLNKEIPNHEYMESGFSPIYMSRNRVKDWDDVSFTIQASGRQAPIHPSAPKMELVSKDLRRFVPGKEHMYRRLSVREVARIQTFPDDFIFVYKNINVGYKMIGNAVPVNLAEVVGKSIKKVFEDVEIG
ncbi:MAG: DNA cytosine methyltransferase [Bacteroidales bacterium]|nr:DNA cytosine methyltransferase [Bacteroidales bacterium]